MDDDYEPPGGWQGASVDFEDEQQDTIQRLAVALKRCIGELEGTWDVSEEVIGDARAALREAGMGEE